MALSPSEMQQVRRALGYGNLLASARPYFDIQLVFEDVVQQNLDPAWGEGYIRSTILPELLAIDAQIIESKCRLKITEVANQVTFNHDEFRSLLGLQEYWRDELSTMLRIPRANKPQGGGDISVT